MEKVSKFVVHSDREMLHFGRAFFLKPRKSLSNREAVVVEKKTCCCRAANVKSRSPTSRDEHTLSVTNIYRTLSSVSVRPAPHSLDGIFIMLTHMRQPAAD
jgi:hypothetical protein